MPVQAMFDDDDYSSNDSEFETDITTRRTGLQTHIRERSHSRHRRPEVISREYLAPIQTRVQRSASTSGRRRERDPPVAPSPPVMIFNEQRVKSNSRSENRPQSRHVQQRFIDDHHSHNNHHHHRHDRFDDDDDDVLDVPGPRRRRRAVSSLSRDASPFHRDPELAMRQHMLDQNDLRQDIELLKHQMEIERLQREVQKSRKRSEKQRENIIINQDHPDPHAMHELREEMAYEDELAQKLAKLARFEHKEQSAEEERKAEERYQLKMLAMEKKAAAEEEEVRHKLQEERLKELARAQDEKGQREKLKLIQEIRDEDMRKAREAEQKRMKELAMKAAAVEEWKLEQERMKQRQAEEAIKKAQEFREHLRSLGYSDEEIDAIVNKKKNDEKKKEEEEKEKKEKEEKEKKEKEEKEKKEKEKEETKLTWIKVHRKHLLPDTLIAYGLPWDWDENDTNYIIIKKWIDDEFQEQLFAHTRRLREGKVIASTSHSMTELKVNDRKKDKLFLVRKKSPSGRVRIFG
ncbi:Pc22g05610 [Penicillium rubens Wisconsin 54-1255]|uniref:Pc22g05610 protein n=1 Tax=Penicillium rubens (strain ATCC 28089 / DSM 1075 / NRRL 1951 / Wisconsin 54-1255) TaxID=500485 RepID=B6HUU5_PENRW|nr:Pc22g05610 [Penicillium rubens Wisconsin 54-1255]